MGKCKMVIEAEGLIEIYERTDEILSNTVETHYDPNILNAIDEFIGPHNTLYNTWPQWKKDYFDREYRNKHKEK